VPVAGRAKTNANPLKMSMTFMEGSPRCKQEQLAEKQLAIPSNNSTNIASKTMFNSSI